MRLIVLPVRCDMILVTCGDGTNGLGTICVGKPPPPPPPPPPIGDGTDGLGLLLKNDEFGAVFRTAIKKTLQL